MCGKMNIDSCDCKQNKGKSIRASVKHWLGVILTFALLSSLVQGCMMVQYGIIYHSVSDAIRSNK